MQVFCIFHKPLRILSYLISNSIVGRMEYYYDNDIKVLAFNASGQIEKHYIIDFYEHLGKNETYPRILKTLIDARDCTYKFEIKDMAEMFAALNTALESYTSVREAIVVEKLFETVFATLFSEGMVHPKYKFRVFSTRKAALNWLTNQ